jgi:hypothetical protein
MNATGKSLPSFYIFRGKWIRDDYIQHCRRRTCMAMQRKAWMTSFLFKEFLSFFKRLVLDGIFQFN